MGVCETESRDTQRMGRVTGLFPNGELRTSCQVGKENKSYGVGRLEAWVVVLVQMPMTLSPMF